MTRTEIINALILKHKYETYLEIGVQNGKNYHAINCTKKVGVDPEQNSKATVYLTSDEYFADAIKYRTKFDIIFIDGLHHHEQVYKDINNALACLSKGGTIVCHDMNPTTEAMQKVPRIQTEWTGDCWKAFVTMRTSPKALRMYVVDTDYGVGIIQRGKRSKKEIVNMNVYEMNYEMFTKYKQSWLNLISVEEFYAKLI